MKKWFPQLSSAAQASLFGISFLLLPFLWQHTWVKNQKGASTVVPNSVPKISAKQKKSFSGIACLDEVRITLGADCAFKVTPNIVAEFNAIDCNPDGMELLITDKSGKAVANNRLTGEHAGQRLKYFLSHPICNPEGCWGIIAVEDKNMPRVDLVQFDTAPVICSKIEYILNNPKTIGHTTRTSSPRQLIPGTLLNYSEVEDNVPNLGIVKFANCDPDCPLTIKWSDRLIVYGCDSLAKNGLYARIFRTWVATNCQGKFIDTVQTINVCRPPVSDFYFNGPDTLGYDRVVTYASCTPNKALIRRIDVTPFATKKRGLSGTVTDTLFLDKQPCSYSMQIKDQEFSICDGRGLKIDRQIYIFDWCNGGIVDTFHVLIKIGDFEAPKISMPHHPVELSTGPINCEASIPLSVKGLKESIGVDVFDNCFLSNLSVKVKSEDLYTKGFLVATKKPGEPWFETPYPTTNGALGGLNPGRHWVIIDAFDACYNSVKDSVMITVADRISPIMVINDELHVSLSNGLNSIRGYAKACVGDVNEGSSDNCNLKWMKVRRNVPQTCIQSFIGKGYDSNNNGTLDPLPADGDWTKADGFDYDGDGKLASFGETFVRADDGRLFSPLMACADFFCCDLAAKVTIELWGEDNSGNRNFAWAEILLEDKIAPRCAAPYDATIFCNDKCIGSIDDRAAANGCFGDVVVLSGNDCESNIDTIYKVIKKLKCGVGTIERIWTITKQSTKGPMSTTCTQIIKVLPLHEYNICFPKDADQKTCAKPLVDSLVRDELACDLLTVNVIDKKYDASDNECYKIFRTFTVLNWCAYDDRCGDPMSVDHVYLVDRAVFNNYGKAPIYVLVRDKDKDGDEEFWLSQNLVPAENVDKQFWPAYCPDAYKGSELGRPIGEYFHSFMYTQIIKVYDEERPLVNIPKLDKIPTRPTDCKADAIINFTAKDNCTDKVELERAQLMVAPFQTLDPGLMIPYVTPRWNIRESAGNAYQVTIRDLPEGKHDLIVVVRDECGNLSLPTRIPFEIRDLKGPAPICTNGLSTDLMPDGNGGGMISVWATDFVASKIYDCNGQGPETLNGLKLVTKYSINRVGETPNPKQTGLNLTCADGGVTINVEIHAWDEAGNHDFCVTYLLVQDNRKVCPSGASYTGEISGLITTLDAEPLSGINIQVSGNASQSQNSDATGKFNFSKLQLGADYTITPQYDKAYLNGVSTLDLVQIQKHILGSQLFKDPFQIIAADVNSSRTITTIDVILVRKLILGLEDKFPTAPSWRFIPTAYKFPNPSNPWQEEYPQFININDLKDKTSSDFVGVKMGDVNGSATKSTATASSLRSNEALHIKAEQLNQAQQNFNAGETLTLALSSTELASVQGYQFTLNFDPKLLALENLEYHSIKAENLGVFAREGDITLSWAGNGKQLASEQTLLVLHFKAKAGGSLPEAFQLNGRRTPAEAYTNSEEVIGVQLDWGKALISPAGALLQQNTPNPFKEETTIEFSLPKATHATLSIRDVAGRLLWSNSSLFAKGSNRININTEAFKGNGVLYYTLEADGFTATRKMIVLD